MIIRHPVTILGQSTKYTARIDDAKVFVTVPRVIFRGDHQAHLVSRNERITEIGLVFKIFEAIADKQPRDAWRLIGQHLNDVYLQGV